MLEEYEFLFDEIPRKSNYFADIRMTSSFGTTLSFKNGKLDLAGESEYIGVGIRVLWGGFWGFSATTILSKKEIQKTFQIALKLAKAAYNSSTNKNKEILDEIDHTYSFKKVAELTAKQRPDEIDIAEKLKLAKEAEKSIRVSDRIKSSTASYSDTIFYEEVFNTNNTHTKKWTSLVTLGISALAREETNYQRASKIYSKSTGFEAFNDVNTNDLAEEIGKTAVKLLNTDLPPSGKFDTLLDPSIVGVYIHEAFGHASEADSVLAKESILEGKIGTKVGVDEISVYDDPTIPSLRGSYPIDSEGTPTENREIVKNGTLVGFLHSITTATKMGAKPNGSARAISYNAMPLVRMGNTYVGNGELSFEELLEMVKDGVYLVHSQGGYVIPSKGQFLFTAQHGYLIKNGELGKMFSNVSLTGTILQVLQKTVGVGKDLNPGAFPGTCGKQGQYVPVSAGGPHLAVKDLVIGGR